MVPLVFVFVQVDERGATAPNRARPWAPFLTHAWRLGGVASAAPLARSGESAVAHLADRHRRDVRKAHAPTVTSRVTATALVTLMAAPSLVFFRGAGAFGAFLVSSFASPCRPRQAACQQLIDLRPCRPVFA